MTSPDTFVGWEYDEIYARPCGAIEFLTLLFGNLPSGVIEFTALAPEGVNVYPRTRVEWHEIGVGGQNVLSTVMGYNRRGYGVYFGVGARASALPPERRVSKKTGEIYTMQPRGSKKHVSAITALWAEVDEADEAALTRLMWCIPYPPSIVVFSGGGWHGYWLLSEPLYVTDENRHAIDRALYALARAAGADTHSAELARVLRLPDTINTKPSRNGAVCHVTSAYGNRYDIDVLLKELRKFAPREAPRVERTIPEQARAGLPRYVEEFMRTGAPVGSRNATLYKVACAYRDAGIAQMTCEQEAAPVVIGGDFTHEEAMRTIDSAYRAEAQPRVERVAGLRMGFGDKMQRMRGGE